MTLRAALAVAVLALAAAPVLGADAASTPAPAAKPAFSTAESTLGALIDNPETKAVLMKHVGPLISDERVEMARGFTLKQVQSFAPDRLTDELLAKIDDDLAAVPAPAAQ